jgi:WD40 repeat protein
MKGKTSLMKTALLLILSLWPCFLFAQEKPEIFVQLGHRSTDVKAAAFSSDGKYLVTGSGDKTVKLWLLSTGAEIRTFSGHEEEVTAVAISPDGAKILSGDKKGFIKLWDALSGNELRTMAVPWKEKEIWTLRFAPDGIRFSVLSGFSLSFWDGGTGRTLRKIDNIRGSHLADRGESYLAAKIGYKDDYALINPANAEEIKKFTYDDQWFARASFSQDGKFVLFMREEYSQKKYFFTLLDLTTGEKISSWQTAVEKDKNIYSINLLHDGKSALLSGQGGMALWDIRQGKKLKVLTTRFTSMVHLSPDGRYFLSTGVRYAPTLWDAASFSSVRSFRQRPLARCNSAQFRPDEKQVLINRTGAPPALLDFSTGGLEKTYSGYSAGYFRAAGRLLLLIGEKGERLLQDLETHKILKKFQSRYFDLPQDGKYLAELIGERDFKIWETRADKEILNYREPSGSINSFTISSDNRHLVLCVDNRVKLIDIASGKETRSFTVSDTANIHSAQISYDGRYLVAFYRDDVQQPKKLRAIVKIWNLETNQEIAKINNARDMLGFKFSPDGRSLLVGDHTDRADSVWLIDPATGRIQKTLKGNDTIWATAFSADGRFLATGDADGSIIVWDVAAGRRKMLVSGHKNGVRKIDFSSDHRQLVSTGDDGPARIWDVATGKEIAQFFSFADGEWITITPEGYFNASAGGAKYLNVRLGNRIYSIDNFYETFFNPVYVASVLQGKKVKMTADIRKGILSPPDVRIISPEPGKEVNADTLTVRVAAKDTGGGVDEIRLYHNGKAIGEDTRAVKIVSRDAEIIKEYKVLLVDGVNTFRAVGFSTDRTESNPYELVVKLSAPVRDVSLHVLAVGINQYKNPALNLNYAQPDAGGIAGFFRQKGRNLFKNVHITEIYNEQATKANMTAKLKQLQNTYPQDAVLIYLAGHGESINDKWYFIPHELTFPERENEVKTKGLSSDELSGLIKGIKAQKILVLVDACKSGAVLIAFRGFEDRKALSQLSRSTGVHVIAASTKDQFAAEVKDLGHGVFTYTILEGLRGKAAGGGKTITVLKLQAYLDEQLPEITRKYRQEAQYPVGDNQGMDFPLAIAN